MTRYRSARLRWKIGRDVQTLVVDSSRGTGERRVYPTSAPLDDARHECRFKRATGGAHARRRARARAN